MEAVTTVQASTPYQAFAFLDEISRGERAVEAELIIRLTGGYYWSEVPKDVIRAVDQARNWAPHAFNYHAYQVTECLAKGHLPDDKYELTSDYKITEGWAALRVKRLSAVPPGKE